MKKKRRHKLSWTNIYSLGLLPAIIMWGLSPVLNERTIIIVSIIIGIIWIFYSFFSTRLFRGCGTIGWITGWALLLSGLLCGLLLLWNVSIPMILFESPCIALLAYLFRHRNIQPPFCHQCILQRGGIRERHILGDFSRYEAYYTIRIILIGALLVAIFSWALFLKDVEIHSRTGTYFYFYFPLGLSLATVIFEVSRRWLIQNIIDIHEKKSKIFIKKNKVKNGEEMQDLFSVIRIMIIAQEKIFLIENYGDKNELDSGTGLDVPIHRYFYQFLTRESEFKMAQQIVQEELQIDKPELRCLSTAISYESNRRVGHYILFLDDKNLLKINRYPGRWYTTKEIVRLFRIGRLYPLFKENYARFHTIVRTALTYYPNGRRRYSIPGYKPAFTLRHIDLMNIEFDDPIWLYVSRHNEDRLSYRIDRWLQKIFSKHHSSNCCDA